MKGLKAEFISTDEHGLVMPIKSFNAYIDKLQMEMAEKFGIKKEDLFSNESTIQRVMRQKRERS